MNLIHNQSFSLRLDSGSSSNNLPTQCSNYVINGDPTRLISSFTCITCISYCDNSVNLPAGWYRFIEGAGTRLATTPATSGACGASSPAYYNGTLPTTVGTTSMGTVCVNWSGNLCHPSYLINLVSVTLCNGYYVFYLTPPISCSIRFCTTM